MVVMQVSVAAALVGAGFLLLSGIAATRGIALGLPHRSHFAPELRSIPGPNG
jgi:hypothetical protein